MIEKFSDEELKQIKRELGIEKNVRKKSTLAKDLMEIDELWREKIFAKNNCILNVIDYTLNNVETRYYNLNSRTSTSLTIKPEDEDEYRQMFREILEIIKKHNRKWEGDVG